MHGILAVGGHEGNGAVAPVVGEARGGVLRVKLRHRQELNSVDAEFNEVGNFLDDTAKGAAQLVAHAGIGIECKAGNVHLVDDCALVGLAQRRIILPIVGGWIDNNRAQRLCHVIALATRRGAVIEAR